MGHLGSKQHVNSKATVCNLAEYLMIPHREGGKRPWCSSLWNTPANRKTPPSAQTELPSSYLSSVPDSPNCFLCARLQSPLLTTSITTLSMGFLLLLTPTREFVALSARMTLSSRASQPFSSSREKRAVARGDFPLAAHTRALVNKGPARLLSIETLA